MIAKCEREMIIMIINRNVMVSDLDLRLIVLL